MPDGLNESLTAHAAGTKREVARQGLLGRVLTDGANRGRAYLPMALFMLLVRACMMQPTIEGALAWLFLLLAFNLMTRPGTASVIHLNHLFVEGDAIYVLFSAQKNDPLGVRAFPRAVYSNDVDPALSLPLALAVYFAATNWLTGSEHASGRVLPKSTESRFVMLLKRLMQIRSIVARFLLEARAVLAAATIAPCRYSLLRVAVLPRYHVRYRVLRYRVLLVALLPTCSHGRVFIPRRSADIQGGRRRARTRNQRAGKIREL